MHGFPVLTKRPPQPKNRTKTGRSAKAQGGSEDSKTKTLPNPRSISFQEPPTLRKTVEEKRRFSSMDAVRIAWDDAELREHIRRHTLAGFQQPRQLVSASSIDEDYETIDPPEPAREETGGERGFVWLCMCVCVCVCVFCVCVCQ